MISKFDTLAQKDCTTRYDRMGNVIQLELGKKLKFDHTTKWYKHKLQYILENETYNILWDFEIKTDHLILTRMPDL